MIAAVFFSNTSLALAQESPDGQTVFGSEFRSIETSTLPVEVVLDETVTSEDLGAYEASVLPDSPWYIFKRIGWQIQEAITFDPVKDAALKHDHAMQQLSEVKQLIDEKGITESSSDVIGEAIGRSQQLLSEVRDVAPDLSRAREDNPAAVDALMAEFADKHIKEQKVLDAIEGQALVATEAAAETGTQTEIAAVEDVISAIAENKNEMIRDFTEILGEVEPTAEAAGARLTEALGQQTGSDLRDLRHLEILSAIDTFAPDSMKAAVAQARKNTVEQFELRIKNIPAAVRTERLKQYVEHTGGEETRVFALLDDIKNTADVPSDVIDKIEEWKELTVRRFERRLESMSDQSFNAPLIERSFANGVQGVIALEEFRNRLTQGSEAAQEIASAHDKAVTAFKERFTDAASQDQADLFSNLSLEMRQKPSPKTFALLRELEQAVQSDPEKGAFLDSLNREMQSELEDRYRREGERFAARYTSLDPQDIAAMETIDIDPTLKAALLQAKTEKLSAYVRDVERPEDFDRMYERFSIAPQVAIQSIKTYDPEFQNALQFRWRKIEQQRLEEGRERQVARSQIDYEERELRHQIERVERKENDEFFRELNQIPWDNFDERRALWEKHFQVSYERLNERYAEQKRLFEARLRLDPFGCDETCMDIQLKFLDQEARQQRERMTDELERERKNIESDKARFERDAPLSGKCTTTESCGTYCREHPDLPGCAWLVATVTPVACAPGLVWDPGRGSCVPPQEVGTARALCAVGTYWDSNSCIPDPYYRPSTKFVQCGSNSFWDEAAGACRASVVTVSCAGIVGSDGTVSYSSECKNNVAYQCPGGFVWDSGRQDCVPVAGESCGQGFYFDYFSKRCEVDTNRGCGRDKFWDEGTRSCVFYNTRVCPSMPYIPCPAGEYRESKQNPGGCWVPGECRPIETPLCPKEPAECPIGLVRTETIDNSGCRQYSECASPICPLSIPRECAPGETPLPPDRRNNPCADWSCVLPPKPICPAPPTGPCPTGMHRERISDERGCVYDGQCVPDKDKRELYYTFSDGNVVYTRDEAVAYCRAYVSESGRGIVKECEENFGVVYEIAICGNNICDSRETQGSCPADCGGIYKGDQYSCPGFAYSRYDSSGKRYCQLNTEKKCDGDYPSYLEEDNYREDKCPAEVTDCNNDGLCDANETMSSCPNDCGSVTACNGDGVCNGAETSALCPSECKAEPRCGDGMCNSGESTYSCLSDCAPGEDPLCNSSPYFCRTQTGCIGRGAYWCSNTCSSSSCKNGGALCGNAVCDPGETSEKCPSDCTGITGPLCATTPSACSTQIDCTSHGFYWCNNACQSAACTGTGCNNNGICDSNETVASCVSDCSSDTTTYCGTSGWHYDTGARSCVRDGASCSTPKACDSCRPSTGTKWCQWNADGCPVSCQTTSGGYCGNNICDSGETTTSCIADCAPACNNNGRCDSGETSSNCWSDCSGITSSCDNDRVCEANESSSSCPSDCSGSGNTACNGNGTCDYGESSGSCPADCGSSGSGGSSSCGTGWTWNSTSGSCVQNGVTCSNSSACSACPSGSTSGGQWCTYESNGCPQGCTSGSSGGGSSTACNNDGTCGYGESSGSCPSDCGGGSCGDRICTGGENSSSCPTDCGTANTETCGNSFCGSSETSASCPADCAGGSYQYCDGICGNGESMAYCPGDCPSSGGGGGSSGSWTACNGNGTCDSGESSGSCPSDCGGSSSQRTPSTRVVDSGPAERIVKGFGELVTSIFNVVVRVSLGL